MRVLTPDEFLIGKNLLFRDIAKGEIFIYPTDTIYGMGCDATNEQAVVKLRHLKEQTNRPFSVIAPDMDWIEQHCVITPEAKSWLRKLPGPYTLVLKLKSRGCVASAVNLGHGTLGVRLVDHPAQKVISMYGKPIVTTSANKSGKGYMTSTEDLDENIAEGIDFCVYEGEKEGNASHIVELTSGPAKVRKR